MDQEVNERRARRRQIDISLNEVFDRAWKDLKAQKGVEVPPEVLLGFRVGDHVDFEEYGKLGFVHPKRPEYYRLDGEKTDPDFKRIYDGIRASEHIDNPITVYPAEFNNIRYLIIIDGATRASVIGYIRAENPDFIGRVQLTPTPPYCSPDDAQAMMVRLNMEGRGRVLSAYEVMTSVERYRSKGRWTTADVARMLGMPESEVCVYGRLHQNLDHELKLFLRDGIISKGQAVELSKGTPEEQTTEAAKIRANLEKKSNRIAPSVVELRRQRRVKHQLLNPMRRIRTFESCLSAIRQTYKSKPDTETKLKGYLDTLERTVKNVKALIAKDMGVSCSEPTGLEKSMKILKRMTKKK